jgi:hypothetical protein
MDDLCEFISEGGTLQKFLREAGLLYGMVYDWLTLDEARNARYQNALKARRANHEDQVIEGILGAAKADVRRAFNDDGVPLDPKDIPDDVAIGMAGYEYFENDKGAISRKIRMVDRTRNLELLGKTSALFK